MTTSPRLLRSCFRRRHFARISATRIPGVSSIKIGASDNAPVATKYCVYSSGVNLPVFKCPALMLACEQIIRSTRDSAPISRLKIATVSFKFTATFFAIFNTKAVLPTDGRAAKMINSSACSPDVILSKPIYPVAIPVTSPLFFARSSKLS